MFFDLALALCLAVLFIVLAGTEIFCAAGLWLARRMLRSLSPRTGANLLFTLRILPLFLAFAVTVGFALPAFLEFEPDSSDELIGFRLLVLAMLGAVSIALVTFRAWRIIRATHRAQKQWRGQAKPFRLDGITVPVYCSDGPGPLLAATGMFRPRIFVSRKVTQNLSAEELAAAIAHEMAHINAWDNLKQLFLKVTQPPRWLKLFRASDVAWLNVSEMAADEGALASGASALDLSSALVKVGRLSRHLPANQMIAASHLLPVAAESSIEMRITHLGKLLGCADQERRPGANLGGKRYRMLASLLLLVLAYAVCLHAVLPWMHETLEM